VTLSREFSATVRRYGDVYVGAGGGPSLPAWSAAIQVGWLDQRDVPSKRELDQFVSGVSTSVSAYYATPRGIGPAGGKTTSKNYSQTLTNIGVGISFGHNISIPTMHHWQWRTW
jgi:hypothetical protein